MSIGLGTDTLRFKKKWENFVLVSDFEIPAC